MTTMTVAFVGLGAMGAGMARAILRAGHVVHGFDVDGAREAAFVEAGGASDAAAVAAADVVVLVVVNAEQAEGVLFGPGRYGEAGLAAAAPDAVVVNCATIAPSAARALAERVGSEHYIDAPVSGGTAKAASGELAILAAGSEAAFMRAAPVLDAMAARVFRLGEDAGAGAAMKVVNQLLAGVHIVSTAEAMTFAMAQGLAAEQTLEVIRECAGTSWMWENRGPHIANGDYTPLSAVDIFVKDLGLVADICRETRFAAPLAATALQQFLAASGSGLGREDDAAVAKIYARNAGIVLPGTGE